MSGHTLNPIGAVQGLRVNVGMAVFNCDCFSSYRLTVLDCVLPSVMSNFYLE